MTRRDSTELINGFLIHFEKLSDPRVKRRSEHLLIDVLFIAICAIICGATSFVEMELFGQQREDWLRQFLRLPSGIPSHDTFSRVFTIIDGAQFEKLFFEYIDWIRGSQTEARICLDGKCVSGTTRAFTNRGTARLFLLNIFGRNSGLVLGQQLSKGPMGGDITAAFEVMNYLKIDGCLISMDAGFASQRLMAKIKEKNADYLIALKKNQRMYLKEAISCFETQKTRREDQYSEIEKSHGRIDKRICRVIDAKACTSKMREAWTGVETVIEIARVREVKDKRFSVHKSKSSTYPAF